MMFKVSGTEITVPGDLVEYMSRQESEPSLQTLWKALIYNIITLLYIL